MSAWRSRTSRVRSVSPTCSAASRAPLAAATTAHIKAIARTMVGTLHAQQVPYRDPTFEIGRKTAPSRLFGDKIVIAWRRRDWITSRSGDQHAAHDGHARSSGDTKLATWKTDARRGLSADPRTRPIFFERLSAGFTAAAAPQTSQNRRQRLAHSVALLRAFSRPDSPCLAPSVCPGSTILARV